MIYLAFTDDWELRGDGSGDPEKLQFQPMRELVRIFNRHGLRASFYVEVMQQLSCRRLQDRHPELKALAERWEAAVVETFRQGHDIQMHLHPQWKDAAYEEGRWKLSAPWSLLDHDPADIKQMLSEGKSYLENLLHRVDPHYRCLAFRAGYWCIAPSRLALPTLAELGFILDTSIVGGIRYRTRNIQLDFRNVEERFWPYYPSMDDARKLSAHPEPIVCMPTHCLKGERFRHLRRDMRLASQHILGTNGRAPQSTDGRTAKSFPSLLSAMQRVFSNYLIGKTHISDISHLDYALLCQIIKNIRTQARASGMRHGPAVLASHSKDIHNFPDIDRFWSDVSRADDLCCVTLTDLARKLTDGALPVRYAN